MIHTFKSIAELADSLSEVVIKHAWEAIRAGNLFNIALSGGSTPSVLFEKIVLNDEDPGLWEGVNFFWVDERCVPFAHEESSRGAAYRSGWLGARSAPGQELPLFLDGERGELAVTRVEAGLARIFDGVLDVVLLGMWQKHRDQQLF